MGRKLMCRVLMVKPDGKRPLGRPRHKWKDNFKMDLKEVGWVIWTGLIWLRTGNSGGIFSTG
jgi:hypothetical protein